MKTYTVLTINPGSTSTKVGLVQGDEILWECNVDTNPDDFKECKKFSDQAAKRKAMIMDILEDHNVDFATIDAVSGRGVGVFACEGGTYEINALAYDHAFNDAAGIHHAATLGIQLARLIGDELKVPSFFVNPMSTDELCDEARMTGVKGLYRPSHAHPLNMKQVAIHHSQQMGKRYEECNYVILHMGGGISVAAHRKGRAIDQTRIGDGQGPISPNRSGDMCLDDVTHLLQRGMTLAQIHELCAKKGGLMDLCGTDDVRVIRRDMKDDRRAQLALAGMEYSMVKWASMMAGALKGEVDAILMTGGLAYDEELVAELTRDLQWIAPIYVYPGSYETIALAAGAQRVLSGEEKAKTYLGEQGAWSGFGIKEWEHQA